MYNDEHDDVDLSMMDPEEDFDPLADNFDEFGEPLPQDLKGLDEDFEEEL